MQVFVTWMYEGLQLFLAVQKQPVMLLNVANVFLLSYYIIVIITLFVVQIVLPFTAFI